MAKKSSGKSSPKSDMKCGEVRKSTREGKKVMQKVCKDGSEKLIHAGDASMRHNYSDDARKNFRARHNCDEAKPGTPKHLACKELWTKGKSVKDTGKGKRK
jgi:hypothetical protein